MTNPPISDYRGHKLLSDRIASAQVRLRDKLLALDVTSSGISEYNQRYLGEKIRCVESSLQLYSRLLYFSLSDNSVPLERFTLVDYGGGSGILSFLAKEIGVGTIVYNDIYDVSCVDVRLLSNIFGLPLDHVFCGDIDDLISYLRLNSLSVDAITSYDVLEHIYDVEYHFKRLGSLSDGQFRVVYASGANIENPWYVHTVTKEQVDTEYKNREKKWGHKERDMLRAYLDVRKEIISSHAPELPSDQVEQLSRLTRGLIQPDIEKCVDEYRRQGSIDYLPDHLTNTCDPYTGNWCEHLMELGWLEQILKYEGFSVEILPGYYGSSGSLLKKYTKIFINAAIRLLGRRGMFLAPYYILYAEFLAEQSAHWTGGIRRHFREVFWLRVFPAPRQSPRPPTCQ